MGNSTGFSESPDCLHKTSFYLIFDIFNQKIYSATNEIRKKILRVLGHVTFSDFN